MFLQVMIDKVGEVFFMFLHISIIFRLVCIPLVMQKQTWSEVGS